MLSPPKPHFEETLLYSILAIAIQYTHHCYTVYSPLLYTVYLPLLYSILTIAIQYTYHCYTVYSPLLYSILTIDIQYTHHCYTVYLPMLYSILTISIQYIDKQTCYQPTLKICRSPLIQCNE